MGLFSVVGSVVGGLFGKDQAKSTNKANLTGVRETNEANKQIAASANRHAAEQSLKAYRRDRQSAIDARIWDRRQVIDARRFDRQQVLDQRYFDVGQANKADKLNRKRFVADREYSRVQAQLAEGRDRANFLENRQYERANLLSDRSVERADFLENRQYGEEQQLAAEARQREYAAADLADARAYADPASERARLEAAGFNPLGRADGSTPMNNIGGSIASAPALLPAPAIQSGGGAQSPSALAISGMGTPEVRVPAGGATAASQIARSQMAKFGVVDPVVPTMQAYIAPHDNSLGEGIADAFASYEEAKMREQEYALRKTQLEIEQQRASELMQRATMRPIVGGVYSNEVGAGREAHVASGGSSVPRAPRIASSGAVDSPPSAGGLPAAVKPETYPLWVDAYDQKTKSYVQIPNPDLMDTGPVEAATGLGAIYGKQTYDRMRESGVLGALAYPKKLLGSAAILGARKIVAKERSLYNKGRKQRPIEEAAKKGVKSPFDPYALGNPWLDWDF